jgi:hypothetical protein
MISKHDKTVEINERWQGFGRWCVFRSNLLDIPIQIQQDFERLGSARNSHWSRPEIDRRMSGILLLADIDFLNDKLFDFLSGSELSANLASSEYKYPKLLIHNGYL